MKVICENCGNASLVAAGETFICPACKQPFRVTIKDGKAALDSGTHEIKPPTGEMGVIGN